MDKKEVLGVLSPAELELVGAKLQGTPVWGDEAIDDLTYRSYAHNRQLAPDISPERWAKVFPNVAAMEERYQRGRA